MKIRPLYDRIVIKRIEERETKREKKPNERDVGPGYTSRMGPGSCTVT